MFFGRSVKKNKFRKAIFITITVLIAIGLVIPLASLFQNQPSTGGADDTGTAQQTMQERLAALEDAAINNPGDKTVLMDLAEAYVYTGNPEKAVQTYEQVLLVDPNQSDARYMIGYIFYMSGEYDKSVTRLRELIQRDPEYTDAHLLYGYVLGQGKKDYSGGIEELEKYISLTREGPEVEKAKLAIIEWSAAQAKK